MDYLFLILGLVLLMLAGDFLVRGSISLAGHFKVSKLVIGVVLLLRINDYFRYIRCYPAC